MNVTRVANIDVSFVFPASLSDTRWLLRARSARGEPLLLNGTRYATLEEAQAQAVRFGYLKARKNRAPALAWPFSRGECIV